MPVHFHPTCSADLKHCLQSSNLLLSFYSSPFKQLKCLLLFSSCLSESLHSLLKLGSLQPFQTFNFQGFAEGDHQISILQEKLQNELATTKSKTVNRRSKTSLPPLHGEVR